MTCQNQSDSDRRLSRVWCNVGWGGGVGSVQSVGRGGQLSISYQRDSNISITQIGPVARHRLPQIVLINIERQILQIPQTGADTGLAAVTFLLARCYWLHFQLFVLICQQSARSAGWSSRLLEKGASERICFSFLHELDGDVLLQRSSTYSLFTLRRGPSLFLLCEIFYDKYKWRWE